MFHRYTEKARRAIFFARYAASQFGSSQIEAEFLLLGVFREDKVLVTRFLSSHTKLEQLRHSIAQSREIGPYIPTSTDFLLTHECMRALAYASEESERMDHKQIDTAHLLLGVLRDENSFAAQLLQGQGLTLNLVREQVHQSEIFPVPGGSASIAGLNRWLEEREAPGNIWIVRQERAGNGTTHFALYTADMRKQSENDWEMAPSKEFAEIQMRIDLVMNAMERAIANHEFEKARLHSDEERKEREHLRQLCEKFNLKEPPPLSPRLYIEIIGDDLFSDIGKRCDDYVAGGVEEVWILDPNLKRGYTVTRTEGLREFKGEILQITVPPLEMDLRRIFGQDCDGA